MSWLGAIRGRYTVSADPLRTQRRIELVVLLLALLLCLQVAYGGLRLMMMGVPDSVAPASDSLKVPPVRNPETVAAEQRNEILARPLFWTTRRPVDEVAILEDSARNKAGASDMEDVKLVGVFGGGDAAGIIALVKGKKRRILLGETLNDWTLESVGSAEGVFVQGGKSETLTLERGDVSAAAGSFNDVDAGEPDSEAHGAVSTAAPNANTAPDARKKRTAADAEKSARRGSQAKGEKSSGLSLGGGQG